MKVFRVECSTSNQDNHPTYREIIPFPNWYLPRVFDLLEFNSLKTFIRLANQPDPIRRTFGKLSRTIMSFKEMHGVEKEFVY